MNEERPQASDVPSPSPTTHRRRPRYSGKNPRRFEDKYKERNPQAHPETIAKVTASGKTPAGTHRPIMVAEILAALEPQPGESAVDCTLGFGGHAEALLPRLLPGGRLLGIDTDPIELPKTTVRLNALGFGPEVLTTMRTSFAGLPQALAQAGLPGVDMVLADLGVSSMQLDDPARGFSLKFDGPLDMRMNPHKGQAASEFLRRITPAKLVTVLLENADEPRAECLAQALAGREFTGTMPLANAIRQSLPKVPRDQTEATVRRVFQAIRIAVNDEFAALDALLRVLPGCLNPGGRAAILTFHSGDDRRVKKAFESGLRQGIYTTLSPETLRASPAERAANPRSASAKLRWAKRAIHAKK